MTDALINDKPQFVRLFTENGLSLLKYLTYGRLEQLYRSAGDGTLLHNLLMRCLEERLGSKTQSNQGPAENSNQGPAENCASGPEAEISLFEVCF